MCSLCIRRNVKKPHEPPACFSLLLEEDPKWAVGIAACPPRPPEPRQTPTGFGGWLGHWVGLPSSNLDYSQGWVMRGTEQVLQPRPLPASLSVWRRLVNNPGFRNGPSGVNPLE
jgi:hypothetical protein